MKFLLICLCLFSCFLSRSQADPAANSPKNLLQSIVEAEDIYLMTEKSKWTLIAGNPKYLMKDFFPFENLIKDKRGMAPLKNADLTFLEKMEKEGNVFIAFNKEKEITLRYFSMNKYQVKWIFFQDGIAHDIQYPKIETLSKDVIWLCKHKWLLQKLSEGSLKLHDYRMTPHEFTLIMRFCPQEWRGSLVKYGVSDNYTRTYDAEHKLAYILENCLSPEKAFLGEYPYLDGVNTYEMYYPELIKVWKGKLGETLNRDYHSLIKTIENKKKLNRKEHFLVTTILKDKELNETMLNSYSVLKSLRESIKKNNDLELLKAYMKRVEGRQSIADIPVLGEFLQSDLYLKGSAEFRDAILDQCALRKENEIVWLLADSVALPKPKDGQPLKDITNEHTKTIVKMVMMKFTHEDLGDDPKVWKKWYRDQ